MEDEGEKAGALTTACRVGEWNKVNNIFLYSRLLIELYAIKFFAMTRNCLINFLFERKFMFIFFNELEFLKFF